MYTLAPLLVTAESDKALDWYRNALGATVNGELHRLDDGRVDQATLDIHGATVVLRGLEGAWPNDPARCDPPGPVTLHLTVDDVAAVARDVAQTGIELDLGSADSAGNHRSAAFRDPFGHRWLLHESSPNAPGAELARNSPRAAGRASLARGWRMARTTVAAALREPTRQAMDLPEYRRVQAEALRYLVSRNINR